MSYDVSLVIDTGAGNLIEVYSWNYTSNVASMWRDAGANLALFNEVKARSCSHVLKAAINRMDADPDRYRRMNPANGWGSFDDLFPRLQELLNAFNAHPETIVRVSR